MPNVSGHLFMDSSNWKNKNKTENIIKQICATADQEKTKIKKSNGLFGICDHLLIRSLPGRARLKPAPAIEAPKLIDAYESRTPIRFWDFTVKNGNILG